MPRMNTLRSEQISEINNKLEEYQLNPNKAVKDFLSSESIVNPSKAGGETESSARETTRTSDSE